MSITSRYQDGGVSELEERTWTLNPTGKESHTLEIPLLWIYELRKLDLKSVRAMIRDYKSGRHIQRPWSLDPFLLELLTCRTCCLILTIRGVMLEGDDDNRMEFDAVPVKDVAAVKDRPARLTATLTLGAKLHMAPSQQP